MNSCTEVFNLCLNVLKWKKKKQNKSKNRRRGTERRKETEIESKVIFSLTAWPLMPEFATWSNHWLSPCPESSTIPRSTILHWRVDLYIAKTMIFLCYSALRKQMSPLLVIPYVSLVQWSWLKYSVNTFPVTSAYPSWRWSWNGKQMYTSSSLAYPVFSEISAEAQFSLGMNVRHAAPATGSIWLWFNLTRLCDRLVSGARRHWGLHHQLSWLVSLG